MQPDVDLGAMAAAGLLDDALRSAWADIGTLLPEPERLAPDGLHGYLADLGAIAAVIVVMPPARRAGEAHMVAVAPWNPPAGRRYLLLSRSWDAAGGPATVLAEWRRDQQLVNLGPGPPADPQAFAEALRRLPGLGSGATAGH